MIDLPTLFNWLFQTAVAFVSTIAFSIIFHTPKKEWLCCGFTGGVGWLVYLVCMYLNTGWWQPLSLPQWPWPGSPACSLFGAGPR